MANFLPAGYLNFWHLEFTKLKVLRRLTLRTPLHDALSVLPRNIPGPLSTIESPLFCELALELVTVPVFPDEQDWLHWDQCRKMDKFLDERFADGGCFKLIIRTYWRRNTKVFQSHAKQGFPLLVRRGCIRFDSSLLLGEHGW